MSLDNNTSIPALAEALGNAAETPNYVERILSAQSIESELRASGAQVSSELAEIALNID
ncbi:MAG: hypothetical protein AAF204_03250 [Pseudomonadota bacterium]